MTENTDRFKITGPVKFIICFRPAVIAFILIMMISLNATRGWDLSPLKLLILICFVAYLIYTIYQMLHWISFEVIFTENGVEARDTTISWDKVKSAIAKKAFHLDTFIELTSNSGQIIKIPAAIQNNNFVLSLCEKHVPNLQKELP